MSQLTLQFFLQQPNEIERLNNWIFETIQPYLEGRVLEINSGQGTLSSRLLEQGFTVQLNATSESNREYLRAKFKQMPLVRGIHKINFFNPKMEVKYMDFQGQFSTVLALNNIEEHAFYDRPAIEKAKRFLQVGGHLIVMGQAKTLFFPGSEVDLNELKKYNRNSISRLLSNCEILLTRFFDWNGLCFISIGKKSDS